MSPGHRSATIRKLSPRVKMGNTINVSNRPDYMEAAGKMVQLMRERTPRSLFDAELLLGLFNDTERIQLLVAVAKLAADLVDESRPAARRFAHRFGSVNGATQ